MGTDRAQRDRLVDYKLDDIYECSGQKFRIMDIYHQGFVDLSGVDLKVPGALAMRFREAVLYRRARLRPID